MSGIFTAAIITSFVIVTFNVSSNYTLVVAKKNIESREVPKERDMRPDPFHLYTDPICNIKNMTANNPMQKSKRFNHHPIFYHFPAWCGDFQAEWVVDFLGIKTSYHYDCENWRYIQHPSRKVPCADHDKRKLMKPHKYIGIEIGFLTKREKECIQSSMKNTLNG
jgi:hypothetical protein